MDIKNKQRFWAGFYRTPYNTHQTKQSLIYAVRKCNQQTPSEVQSHTKPARYAINWIAKANA